jgi:hypothetical protein
LPVIIRPAYPAKRSIAPQFPPTFDSPQIEVRGERAHHEERAAAGAKVPVSSPTVTRRGLEGCSGSRAGSSIS